MKMSAVSTTSSSVSDLVALHRGLERADRVDLGDDHAGALGAQRLGAALADVAEAADDGDLAGDHHVGGAVDAVDQRVAAAVEVVELRLGDRVVDVDRREQQLAGLGQLVEAVDAGGGLLGDALDARRRSCVQRCGSSRERVAAAAARTTLELLGLGARGVRHRAGAPRTRLPLWTSSVASPPSSRIMFGPPPSGQRQRLLGAPPVLLERLALPGEDRDALRGLGGAVGPDRDRRGGVVLGREDVAARPSGPRRRAR